MKRVSFLILLGSFQLPGMVNAQSFNIRESTEGIEISENGAKVLFFQKAPKTIDGQYERAGYIHPLYDLNGNVVTEDGPKDHPYHRGIFWAWHQIMLNNKKVADGWMSEHISFQPVKITAQKSREGVIIHSQLLWKLVVNGSAPVNIIGEKTTVTIHPSKGQYRLVDVDIHVSALMDGVALGGSEDPKGYGGFCMRLKFPDSIRFISQGREIAARETAVTAGPWMDFVGTGIAAFCAQPVSPQPWILRTKTSMQNIPVPGNQPKPLLKEGWSLKYRMVIHSPSVNQQQLEQLYQQYTAHK